MIQEWFKKAKLGIFIHYGIYAVKGTSESWAFKNGECSYKKYMRQKDGFTAANYDAVAWAKLFKSAGATYAVLTAKHHDGVALYDTAYSDLSTVKATPAKKDIVTPYCDALRNEGLRVGIYFTQLDWSHPDYLSKSHKPFAYKIDNKYHDKARWKNFLEFHHNQLTEVLTKFGQVDLLWFDGDWERSQADWRMKEMKEYIESISPKTVVNSRIGSFGDYATPEQQMPVTPPDGAWEYCMTINDNWGYRPQDNNYKPLPELIRTFCEIISLGGNLLLDVGPMEDGTIDSRAAKLLKGLGDFINDNHEAVFDANPIVNNYFAGGVLLSDDKKSLYLFNYRAITTQIPILVNNLDGNVIVSCKQLTGGAVAVTQNDGYTWLTCDTPTDKISVIKLTFKDEFKEMTK